MVVGRGGGFDSPEVVQAYATPDLAFRVSGHLFIALAIKYGANRCAWGLSSSSLLSGGYKGAMAAQIELPIEEVLAKDPPFKNIPGGVVPVSLDRARTLAWGMFAWSLNRGLLDDGDGYDPGIGALKPPSGPPESWEQVLGDFFFEEQLGLVDAALPLFEKWDGPAEERQDIMASVTFHCITDKPLTLTSELDRRPMEFEPAPKREGYIFHPRRDDDSPLANPQQEVGGVVVVQRDDLAVLAPSATYAAILASRLEELAATSLQLQSAVWIPLRDDDDIDLISPPR
jgi:hypothetical protein